MRMGTENKRQVYFFSALCVVIVAIAAYEFQGMFESKPIAHAATTPRTSGATNHAPGPGTGVAIVHSEPKLRIGLIFGTERVQYSATGRDIFSVEAAPVKIEAPLAPARPETTVVVATPPPEHPKPPAIDIKYLGYTQGNDKIYNAILIHGDDSLMARSGDIIFHRYKVGPIQPASVQVTDLSYNRTQTISITDK